MMSALTDNCRWEDETQRERTSLLASYAEATIMKSPIRQTHGFIRASFSYCPSLLLFGIHTLTKYSLRISQNLSRIAIALQFICPYCQNCKIIINQYQ